MATNQRNRVGEDVLSPITNEQRHELFHEVQEWYEDCATSQRRFAWCEDEDGVQFNRPCLIERDRTPTVDEWLDEETGRKDFLWGWTTYGNEVFHMSTEVVREAYRQRFGDDWNDDGELDDASCTAETKLNHWVTDRLKKTQSEKACSKLPWQKIGF